MASPGMPQSSYELTIFADYFQIYLQDELAQGDLSESWTQEAIDNFFAVAPGTIGMSTARNMDVPLSVHITTSRPLYDDFSSWDQVIEASIDVPSGKIVVMGTTDYLPDALRIPVEPGTYRARIYSGDLESLSEDGLEGDDHYQVIIWPEAPSTPVVLKQRHIS